MGPLAAFAHGIRRVNGAPAVLFGAIVLTLLVPLPLSIVLGEAGGHRGVGEPRVPLARAAAELSARAPGLATAFAPGLADLAAVLDRIPEPPADGRVPGAIASLCAAWLAVWAFLSAGIVDRYARQRPTRAAGFFAACGACGWRLLRLGVLGCAAYAALAGWLYPTLAGEALRSDTVVARPWAAGSAAPLGLFWALTASLALLFDYARVRIVVEDRRSALGALMAAARFMGRNPRRVGGLFLLNLAASGALAGLYSAASAAGAALQPAVALAAGAAYIMGRHYLALLVFASEAALFQGALAHAAYTAAPAVVWPDAPAVESMTNAPPQGRR